MPACCRLPLAALALALFHPVPLPPAPCLWDSDTLADELRGIPDAFLLITGRWYRHTELYYRIRIDRLPDHLEAHPDDFGAYDDLAVAYERVGRRDEAIEIMRRKKAAIDRFEPEDTAPRYRYRANLGTFLAHSGRFDAALRELRRAVEINPDAHFGRERYQIDLIRYLQAAREQPSLWTEHDFLSWAGYAFEDSNWLGHITLQGFTGTPAHRDSAAQTVAWEDAWTGIAGMLRYGGIEGAELYRALGDLASAQRHLHLAWYAYGVAITKGHPAADRLARSRDSIVDHQRKARRHNGGPARLPDAAAFEAALDNSARWLRAFQRLERTALAMGRDTGDPDALRALIESADRLVPPTPRSIQAPHGSRPIHGPPTRSHGPAEGERQAPRAQRDAEPRQDGEGGGEATSPAHHGSR